MAAIVEKMYDNNAAFQKTNADLFSKRPNPALTTGKPVEKTGDKLIDATLKVIDDKAPLLPTHIMGSVQSDKGASAFRPLKCRISGCPNSFR